VEHDMEDNNSTGRHQLTLSIRGTEIQPAFYMDESLFYNWRRLGSRTPLPRGKVLPKLAKMGIPMTILNGLSSTQLSEVLCLICVILYDTRAQKMGVPDYVPGPYRKRRDRNRSVSADMAMEKIILISPAVYFNILRNMDLFTVDSLRDPSIWQQEYVQMAFCKSQEGLKGILLPPG
jgi:hypothetical protein